MRHVVAAPAPVIVRPWYRQFYLRRGAAEWRSDQISDEGYSVGLETLGGFVYVGTTTYGSPTRLTIRVHSSDPGPSRSADRTAEALLTGDGDLAVLNWNRGDPAVAEVALPTGDMRARMSWHGTAAAQAHPDCEIGGEDLSPEHLVLDLWPAG